MAIDVVAEVLNRVMQNAEFGIQNAGCICILHSEF